MRFKFVYKFEISTQKKLFFSIITLMKNDLKKEVKNQRPVKLTGKKTTGKKKEKEKEQCFA